MSDETLENFKSRMNSEYEKRGAIYFDRQGREMQLMDWGSKFEDKEYQIVKQDRIVKYFVSTVWLGINHRFMRQGPPLIFETMVFVDDEKDPLNEYQEKYSTEEEALNGHEDVISIVKDYMSLGTSPPGTVTEMEE